MEREDEEAVLLEIELVDFDEEEGDAIPWEWSQTSFTECRVAGVRQN
jgi:hypothetical protein